MPLISGNVNFRLCSKSEKIVHSRTLIQQKRLSHFSQVVCEKETVALKYSFSYKMFMCVCAHGKCWDGYSFMAVFKYCHKKM